jgi:hypothetical protein
MVLRENDDVALLTNRVQGGDHEKDSVIDRTDYWTLGHRYRRPIG